MQQINRNVWFGSGRRGLIKVPRTLPSRSVHEPAVPVHEPAVPVHEPAVPVHEPEPLPLYLHSPPSPNEIGFIILRHVNNKLTNQYWNHCYDCIRKFYPEHPILIIDDNSKYEYITARTLYKTTIIKSEYPGRGELLPYYYYLHNKLFDTAVILHDSVFINKYIDMTVNTYKIIWDFEHGSDQIKDETIMIKLFNDTELLNFYENKQLWKGCFGGMSIITHAYLTFINNKYDISKLLDYVLVRYNRCSFERVIACLLQKNEKMKTLLGNIHLYCRWGITFDQKDKYKHLPMTKVWTGR